MSLISIFVAPEKLELIFGCLQQHLSIHSETETCHARSGKQARTHKHILESVGSALPLRVRMLAGHCARKAFCLGSLKLVIAP